MLKVINVAGARPNFMKVAPIVAAMNRRAKEFRHVLVHTGQHYDSAMSEAFFRDLEIPEPDIDLGVGSGSHALQTAGVIQAFEPYVIREKPDWVLVVGDVNSTVACALVCAVIAVVAPLVGVPVPEPPAGEAVYASPATAAVAGCTVVAPPRCAKSYAMAPPRTRVAMTFSVMNTIATRSRMSHPLWAYGRRPPSGP